MRRLLRHILPYGGCLLLLLCRCASSEESVHAKRVVSPTPTFIYTPSTTPTPSYSYGSCGPWYGNMVTWTCGGTCSPLPYDSSEQLCAVLDSYTSVPVCRCTSCIFNASLGICNGRCQLEHCCEVLDSSLQTCTCVPCSYVPTPMPTPPIVTGVPPGPTTPLPTPLPPSPHPTPKPTPKPTTTPKPTPKPATPPAKPLPVLAIVFSTVYGTLVVMFVIAGVIVYYINRAQQRYYKRLL